jgi:Xaa-Pro aminopeptidase
MSVFAQRCKQAQGVMQAGGIDWLFIPHSTDLRYLIGYSHRQSERLALFLLPATGPPRFILPSFEEPVLQPYADFFKLIGWEEQENPVERVRVEVGGGAGKTIACGDDLHAVMVLDLQAAMPEAKFLPGRQVLSQLRMVKDLQEQSALQTASRITDLALSALLEEQFTDWSELEIRSFLHRELLRNGCESVGTGIVASGPNSASPHHRTGGRIVQPGDALVIDFGGAFEGYRSDMTRTFFIGEPPEEFINVYEIVREAQTQAVRAVGPGVMAETIDQVARGYITSQGYGPNFLHRTGHGIGLDGHEHPYIVEGNKTVLQSGMTFSVEPGIYLPGKFGVRLEDILQVTDDGAESLNKFPLELMSL